jgi:glycosyltransferase involved in cell wall biosynthesis
MNVGIDGRSLARGRAQRGVAHYARSLVAALAEAFPGDTWRVLAPGGLCGSPPPGIEVVAPPGPARLAHAAAAVAGRPRLDRRLGGRIEVAWAPAPAPLALSRVVPLVLTVHDLSFAERPGDYTAYERLWHRLARPRSLALRAARLMADSAATRDALAARWDVPAERVAVVAPGVSRPAAPPDPRAAQRRFGLAERWFLWVGALEPRKAPDVMARGWARARAAGLDAELVVVGDGRSSDILRGPGVRRLGTVPRREDLFELYAGALAVVTPSWAEGYGLPPLEAAACGTPALVSDLPVFRETLGDAALRVPPGDEATLSDGLLRLAGDPGLRARLAAAAAVAIEGRTWEAAAHRARAVLGQAAAGA